MVDRVRGHRWIQATPIAARRIASYRAVTVSDPQTDVETGKNLTPQCAFKMSMINVSAIHIKYRS
jgi:hypothetical protein